MPPYISFELRELVAERARHRCEYCLLPETATLHRHEPDHIVPHQHSGITEADNLALACFRCNRLKGPNVGSFDPETGNLVPFFNPRVQEWTGHFALEDAMIVPLTAEGRVTAKLLRLNDEDRLEERRLLLGLGLYGLSSS